MRSSFTDTFIKHPVLAVVVNLVIVLVGWRAISTLPLQQYPKVESSSVLIKTIYYGASAETVRKSHALVRRAGGAQVTLPSYRREVEARERRRREKI